MVFLKPKAFFVFLSILISLCYVYSESESENAVVKLNDENFENAISQGNHFVMFFAPWCGHCKRLHPIWGQLADLKHNDADSNVIIAQVDCTENKIVCTENEITGYPTLRFFKQNEKESVKFKGTRDLPAFVSFINEQLNPEENADDDEGENVSNEIFHGKLYELTEDTFPKHVSSGKHFVKFYAPWCGHCQSLAPTWDELAKTLDTDEATISKIDCTVYRSICQDFEVKGYPTLLWIEDGKKIDKYSGDRALDSLKSYVHKMLGVPDKPAVQLVENDGKSDEDKKRVIALTTEEFNKIIAKDVTFIKFYAPWCGHCQKLSPTWDQLAGKFHSARGDVKIAKVDCTAGDNRILCAEQQVEGYPTLNIYKNGKKLSEYDGTRSLPELERFVHKVLGRDEL